MTRIGTHRIRARQPRWVLAALAALALLIAGLATVVASSGTRPAADAGLTSAFEIGRHIPGAAIGGIRPGTLHTGAAGGTQWAIATFTPSASAAAQVSAQFQDGAATAVFTMRNGRWRLVETGPYGCGQGLPAALKQAWGLGNPARCAAQVATQRAEARGALSAFPAQVRAAALAAMSGDGTGAVARNSAPADRDQVIAAIALSQVGVGDTPVATSFAGVNCNPYSTLVAGFSANSNGCGEDASLGVRDENETWCADFNKWVWEQAGVTEDMDTLNAGSTSFYDWARQQGEPLAPSTGTPAVGDSIVFFSPGEVGRKGDHVGIVTAVNAGGTIDMVNGDFMSSADVHVEYDTGIQLTSWAASVWGAGEEWFIVTPPTAAQQPGPAATMSAPHTAVAGTDAAFHAQGAARDGSITGYYWTFGDGRTTNSAGQDVTHVYQAAGTYTASVTVTSSSGTISTLTRNVTVLGVSSAVAAVPSDSVWWATTPVDEYLFTRSAGGLAVDSWAGASWLQLTVPGRPSATGTIAALSYPDPANAGAMTPHAYYRAANGSLALTYQAGSGWVTRDLPGKPAAGGAIVAATTTSGGPAVFFVDTAGNLAQTVLSPGGWTTSEPLHGGPAVSASSLTLAATVGGIEIFAVGADGTIRLFSSDGGTWSARTLPVSTATGGSLAAVTTPDGAPAVFYRSADGGSLAEATRAPAGDWTVTDLPGSPAPGSSLAATSYLLPSAVTGAFGSFPAAPGSLSRSGPAEPLGTEAFYLTASGAPAVAFDDGTGWQTAALPGRAGAITGVSAYQVAYQPMRLFLSGAAAGAAEEATSGTPSGTWRTRVLPGAPATFADRVVLYAATPDDKAAALSAAVAAGLPASQVTTSFATAWDDTLSGSYLVISVGLAATDALDYNQCGWSNPSTGERGKTPFWHVTGPARTLPAANAFEDAAAATAPLAKQRATDLAYYAVHGTLPHGATAIPAAATPVRACSGSATA